VRKERKIINRRLSINDFGHGLARVVTRWSRSIELLYVEPECQMGYHSRVQSPVTEPTQPPTLSVTENDYQMTIGQRPWYCLAVKPCKITVGLSWWQCFTCRLNDIPVHLYGLLKGSYRRGPPLGLAANKAYFSFYERRAVSLWQLIFRFFQFMWLADSTGACLRFRI